MRNTNKRQGFTIVELVIVIAVIAILAGVLIPTFSNVIQKAKDSRDQQDALNIYKEQVLALKADNELKDTNNSGKEEVLVVLRENQTDVKYFLFVDGKCMESTADASCDIIVTEEGVSQGNNQGGNQNPDDSGNTEKTHTLTKVTDISQLEEGLQVVIGAYDSTDAVESTYLMAVEEHENHYFERIFLLEGEYTNQTVSLEGVAIITLEKAGENWRLKIGENAYLSKRYTGNQLTVDEISGESIEWKIEIVENIVNIKSAADTEFSIQYYKTNNSERFNAYSSSQQSPTLYIVTEN